MLHRGHLVWALWALTLFSVPPAAAGEAHGPDAAFSGEALTREQAVAQALATNPTLKAFERELEAARARRLQADGFDPPTFFWDFEEAERLGSPSRFGNQVLGVEQNIEWFGVRRARKEAAALGVDAAEALLDRARSRIAARTRKAFDEVLQARAAVELLERMTTLAGEAVEARARPVPNGCSELRRFPAAAPAPGAAPERAADGSRRGGCRTPGTERPARAHRRHDQGPGRA